jgi:hypothetical protein
VHMARAADHHGTPDQRERMSQLRLDLVEQGWTVFHPEPHGDGQWFAAATNLPPGEHHGTAQVGGGASPLEAMEILHEQISKRRESAT